jgi:hypothetical protein
LVARWLHKVGHPGVSKFACLNLVSLDTLHANSMFTKLSLMSLRSKEICLPLEVIYYGRPGGIKSMTCELYATLVYLFVSYKPLVGLVSCYTNHTFI